MTREEAIEKIERNKSGLFTHFEVKEIVNEVYDDFESRICKNCKYYMNLTDGCKNHQNTAMNGGIYILVTEKFGCNKFERREDERDYIRPT